MSKNQKPRLELTWIGKENRPKCNGSDPPLIR
jgi:hypothetical protein